MLRTLFVLTLAAIGGYYALQGPFFALLFYIGNAYFRPEEWAWNPELIRSFKLSLLIGIYVTLSSLFSRQQFVWNGRIALLFLFLLHTFFSTLFAEHFTYSWGFWIDFLKTIIITYLLTVLVTDFRRFRLVLLVMVLALGLEQAKQGWVYLLTSPDWHNENPLPFLGDNNGVAVGMLMLAPLVGLLAQTTRQQWARPFYWLIFVGVVNRALSTHSRGAFLAFLAMGGVYLLRSRQKWKVLFSILVALALILPALPDTFWSRMKTIQTYEEDQDMSALGRLHFWSVAFIMAKANPLWGVGYNGYNLSYNDYDFSHGEYNSRRAERAEKGRSVHSSFLAVLAELGFVGAALYGLIIISAFRSCHRIRKLTARNMALSDLSKSALAFETSLVAFVVGGSLVCFQYNEMLWHIIGLTLAIELLAVQQVRQSAITQPREAQVSIPVAHVNYLR